MTTNHDHLWKHFPNSKPPKKRCQNCGILVEEKAKKKDCGPCRGKPDEQDNRPAT